MRTRSNFPAGGYPAHPAAVRGKRPGEGKPLPGRFVFGRRTDDLVILTPKGARLLRAHLGGVDPRDGLAMDEIAARAA